MSTGKYEANPGRLRRGTEEIGILPGLAQKLGDDFVAAQSNYLGMNGTNDDFYYEVQPNYEANNRALLRMATGLAEAYWALKSATFGNLQNIEGTQLDAVDRIQLQSSRMDAYEGDGGGKY